VRCRLFADQDGVWGKEADPGPREGIHHELSKETQVVVQHVDGDEELVVTPRRHSLYDEHSSALAAMKLVCLRAIQERALLLTEFYN